MTGQSRSYKSQRSGNNLMGSRLCNAETPATAAYKQPSSNDCNPTHLRRNYAFSNLQELKL